MRVLVGYEESGVVRNAFNRIHDIMAWSCDLIPSRNGGPHLQKDIREVIVHDGPWSIIIIHPPCTALSVSGNAHYAEGKGGYQERLDALDFTESLWVLAKRHALIGVCLENPVGVLSTKSILGKASQYIQPYQFGHPETKKTGLWLSGLPKLTPTDIVDGRENRIWKMPPSATHKRDGSETYEGIAKAMAQQWGGLN